MGLALLKIMPGEMLSLTSSSSYSSGDSADELELLSTRLIGLTETNSVVGFCRPEFFWTPRKAVFLFKT